MRELRCVICKVPHKVVSDGPELLPDVADNAILCTAEGRNSGSEVFMGGGLLFLVCDVCVKANEAEFIFYLPVPEHRTRMINVYPYKVLNKPDVDVD